MLLICTCPEYCWCYLKVKFDGSSEEFIISITSLVCSRFMCFQLATFWLPLKWTVQTILSLSACV